MSRLVITCLLALLVRPAVGAGEHEFSNRLIRRTLEFGLVTGAPRLRVDNVWGNIEVRGEDRSDVRLEVIETIHAESATRAVRAREEVELEISSGSGEIDLFVAGPFRDRRDRGWEGWRDPGYTVTYDFEIHIPRRCDLDLRTVTDGEVSIHDVTGTLAVRNVNGAIRLERSSILGGLVETVNGPIRGRFDAAPLADLDFSTVNGPIDVTYPPMLAADLRLVAPISAPILQMVPLPVPPPTRRTENGRLVIEVGHGAAVRVGRGGPRVSFETFNGDIFIRKEGRTR